MQTHTLLQQEKMFHRVFHNWSCACEEGGWILTDDAVEFDCLCVFCVHVCGLCVHQVEEQEEAVVKVQADLSVYRATHTHPDTDYDHQLRRMQDLEEVGVKWVTLSQTISHCYRVTICHHGVY